MAIALAVKEALSSSSMIRKMFEEGAELKKKYGTVFDFSIGNPDLEPPPAFHRVFAEFAEDDRRGLSKGSHGYMSNAGFADVREALAKKASAEQGCEIPASRIVMAAGAAGGLNVVCKSILNPGDELVVPKPYFMEYRAYVSNHGGKLVEAPTRPDFNLDLGAVEESLSEKTAAVLVNSPHNPTGVVYPEKDIAALAALLRGHGEKTGRYPYLVADEPYREIAYGLTVPPLLCAYENSIVVTSYSKSLSLPGERIGYIAVGPEAREGEELVAALIYATRVLGFVNAPALMQRIVARLTGERVAVGTYEKRREAFMNVLDGAGIEYRKPEGAFYLFCKVPRRAGGNAAGGAAGGDDSGNDRAFSDCLKKHLVLGVPGSSFGAPGWIRFAYCVDESVIASSARAFRDAVEEWRAAPL
ncbi:MAG: pyridoxal phosphate-dependent aminotransferase [Treponema sp.]|jgi:aspartate aminotransferase|nr:pyridoxal phosphate-dependent aminotransferase [Treponema sp.]